MSLHIRLRRGMALAVAVAATLLLAVPARAHPFVQGGEVPADSLATMTLDLAHGCGSEETGEGSDTTEVALEAPEWLRIVEVPEPDGWSVELDHAEDDPTVVEVVTWTTDDPREPAPAFDLDVVASGEVGEERYLGVFQACGDTTYRWVGTPDEPADDPAVRMVLAEPDPDAPPPPEPEEGAEPDADADPDVDPETDEDETVEPDPVDDPADAPADDDPADDAEDPALDDARDAADDPEAAADADDGPPWLLIVAVVVVLAALAALAAVRARGGAAGTEG